MREIPVGISVAVEGEFVKVTPNVESTDPHLKALHGMVRAVVANLIAGVSTGFKKVLEIVGTGYRAQMEGKKLILLLGFAKPVEYMPPSEIQISVESPTRIVVAGIDKVLVGQVAADIRDFKSRTLQRQGDTIRR